MKYAMIIPDGAADEPLASLQGRTPLQAARLPEMDRIASSGTLGRSRNVPERFLPGSDVATLSLLGYDPKVFFTGRAPLEAAAMGIRLGPDDWAVRCNLLTIDDGRMADFTAGHISNEEANQLIDSLSQRVTASALALAFDIEFRAGVSYRNLMIARGKRGHTTFGPDTTTTPPHDIPGQPVADHRPFGTGADLLERIMKAAAVVLPEHPVNRARLAAGKRPANAAWLWGQGMAPALRPFDEVHGLKGAIVSAVDLVRGVGMLAGWTRIDVPGATGYLDTDYAAKGRAAIEALGSHDMVCIHIEAPDEASHEGRADAKIEALERIDHDIVGPLHNALQLRGEYRILVTPDHSTLIRTKAHDRAPVPWAMCGTDLSGSGLTYDEVSARANSCPYLNEGWRLMSRFVAPGGQH
jgi:2,3-bisphosphoglycerate-independent phosphoglycerate mutase